MNRKRIKELAADAELGIFQETSIIGRRARIEAAILAALEEAFSEEATKPMMERVSPFPEHWRDRPEEQRNLMEAATLADQLTVAYAKRKKMLSRVNATEQGHMAMSERGDLEVRACADAMGLEIFSTDPNNWAGDDHSPRTEVAHPLGTILVKRQNVGPKIYNPLIDDAQAMALLWLLIQRGSLSVLTKPSGGPSIFLFTSHANEQFTTTVESQEHLRRALVETVAHLSRAG